MAHCLFAKSSARGKSLVNRRRRTRVNAGVPIVVSGRNASGLAFRDVAHAVIVGLRDVLLPAPLRLLVDMWATIEGPPTRMTDKAICVRGNEPMLSIAGYSVDRV